MLFYEMNIGEKAYNLKLNTKNVCSLEKNLGCNPLMIFGEGDRIPTVSEMVEILFYSLQAYNHEITKADAYKLFDDWLNDGNVITDFIPIIIEIYKVSGLIRDNSSEEKNA